METENLVEKKQEPNFLVDILQSIVIAIFVCIVVYLFIATPNQVYGDSMEPNFSDGELLLTNRVVQWFGATDFGQSVGVNYARGDVIVFQKPGAKDFIKRIIGMPGEKISIVEGKIYIDGQELSEEYIPPEIRTNAGSFLMEGDEVLIPDGNFFAMGDNRNNSQDSRYTEVGFISRDWIKGKVILRYWPVNLFSIIGSGESALEESS